MIEYTGIHPYPIGGVNNSAPAIQCTGFGHTQCISPWNHLILIPRYYCKEVFAAIVSQKYIVCSHLDIFVGWKMTTDVDN